MVDQETWITDDVSEASRSVPQAVSDLLRQTAEGCPRAFESLYVQMFGRVEAVVRRELVDASQSEEVAQEVMLEIWEHADRFDLQRGDGVGWMLTIARRRAIDRVRAAQTARRRDREFTLKSNPAAIDHVSETVELRFDSARLHLALEKISPIQRDALVATYFDGRTIVDLATEVGRSQSAVKTRMRDGLAKLRIEFGLEAA